MGEGSHRCLVMVMRDIGGFACRVRACGGAVMLVLEEARKLREQRGVAGLTSDIGAAV